MTIFKISILSINNQSHKRFIYLLILTVFSVTLSTGQIQMPAATKAAICELQLEEKSRELGFANAMIASLEYGSYVPFTAKVSHDFNKEILPGFAGFGSRTGDIATIRIHVDYLNQIEELQGIEYIEIAPPMSPDLDRVLQDMRVDSVHMTFNNQPVFSGKDVIIGVTDWGFDYTHPMFYDTSLSETRIIAAWDQFKNAGPNPTGFSYGTEYEGASELLSAQSDTACVYYDYATHGSHVAGIAAGSGGGTAYRGVAFESELLFVAVYLNSASMIDAVNWMKSKADAAGKRLVVNMSWGLYFLGPLDGTSLLSQALDDFSEDGIVIVTSGGNNGDVDFHIKKDFNNDSIQSKIDFYPYSQHESMWGQSITMWGDSGSSFESALEIYDGSNSVAFTPRINTKSGPTYIDTMMVINLDTIYYNVSIESAHPLNSRPHMRLRVKNESSLKVHLKSWANSGTVHYWNVTELSNGAGNWGMPLTNAGPAIDQGDNEYGIGEPACTESVISIAAHRSESRLPDGTVLTGNRTNFSSIGPTMDERIKPDVSAPGASVASAISSFTTRSYTAVESTTFNGRTYDFGRFSGTSMASPAAAGLAALILQSDPNLTPAEVKEIMQNTAREDDKTGTIPTGGSTSWGHGKVTATSAINESSIYQGINDISEHGSYSIFPNPTEGNTTILLPENQDVQVAILNSLGQQVDSFSAVSINAIELNLTGPKGLYFIRISASDNSEVTLKILKN